MINFGFKFFLKGLPDEYLYFFFFKKVIIKRNADVSRLDHLENVF